MTAMAYEAAAAEWETVDPAEQWATPGELAVAVDPSTVQTPALDLIDEALVWAYSTRGARLIISIGPQEGKTSRVARAGVLWALRRNPELRVGVISYAVALARISGRTVRNWVSSFNGTDGTLDLGLRVAADHSAASDWQLDGHRGGMISAGLRTGIAGRPLDVLIIDDPFSDRQQAESIFFRDLAWEWWQSTGSARLAPGAPVIQVATRWHEDDLAGRMIAAEDGHRWRVINIPALADHKPEAGESDPLGREPGEWLRSARGRTAAEWEQIRIQTGSRNFTALYQGRPSPDQGNVWLRQWWRRYREPLWSQHPTVPGAYLVRDMDEVVMSWDMAFKDTKSSDFVVGQVWARRAADVFLLDQVHKRLSFTDTLIAFAAMVARWPQATRKLVEDKANGTAVISTLKSKIPGLVAINPTDSKYGRATAVAPFIEAGNAYLPDKEIALFDPEPLITEAAGFPNAAHDDMVDATSQALAEMLLDGNGAAAWIAWAKRKAEEAAAGGNAPEAEPAEPPRPAPAYSRAQAADALRLVMAGAVTETSEPGVYQVASAGGNGTYRVTADTCECPAGEYGTACKHRAAVAIKTAQLPAEPPAPVDPVQARKLARDAAMRAQNYRR